MADDAPLDDAPSPPYERHQYVESDRVEGTAVYDVAGHRVGEVKRLIIEKASGQVAFVVVSFGTFFGIGEGNHALAWSKLHYDQDLDGYRADVTEDELKAAPDFPARTAADEDPGFRAYYRIPPSGRAL